MKLMFLACLLPAALVTGCQQSAAPPATPDNATTVVPAAAQIATIKPQSSSGLRTEPASLHDCEAKVVNVIWDLSKARPDAPTVEVWVGEPASAKMFAAGGNQGQAMTGLWATPGTTFSLRLPGTTETLAQATVGGPACPAGS